MNQTTTVLPPVASEGFKASATKPQSTVLQRLKRLPRWLLPAAWLRPVILALGAACLIELLVFNQTALFFDQDTYEHQVVPLPQHSGLGQPAFVVSAQQNSVNLTLPDVPLKSVYLRLAYGSRYLVTGSLELRTTAAAYMWSPVGNFSLSGSGRDETSAAYLKILPKGEVKELRLRFDPKSVGPGVAIVALELNKPLPLDLKPLRIMLLALILAFAWSTVTLSWRSGRVIVGARRFKRITRSVLAVMVLGSGLLFYATSPYVATEGGFKFIGEGFVPYNTPGQSLLIPLPKTPQEYAATDEYTQMLAAYSHGQLHLPYPADPRLEQVTNVYDNSELFAKEIPFLWDHAYYEGKYYVYFGVAPLITIYLPIYLVTGEAPCAALAAWIATLYALLALYWGVTQMLRAVVRAVNPLLLALTLLTMGFSSGIFLLQAMLTFYILPYLLGFVAVGLTLGTLPQLARLVRLERLPQNSKTDHKTVGRLRRKAYAHLVVLGLAVIIMVTSRPLNLLYLIIMLAPMLWWYLRQVHHQRSMALAAACTGVPVIVGAILVMWYNYARFGSVFEFGQFNQLTMFDTHYHQLELNFELFWAVLYHFFWENFELSANFPYVLPITSPDLSMGNYTAVFERAGLLFFPIFWTLPLIWLLLSTLPRGSARRALVLGLTLCGLLVPILMLAVGINAGFNMRYICDATMIWAPLTVIACLHLDYAELKPETTGLSARELSSRELSPRALVYWAIVAACVFTCGAMFFVTFSANGQLTGINPELMVELKRFFDPLSFT